MSNFNKVILMGRLTRDPEKKEIPSGANLCEFGLAVNRTRKKGEDEVCFLDITCWNTLADNCYQYLKKGALCLVEGHLNQREWENKPGQKQTKIQVVAGSVTFMSKGIETKEQDDIPF